jgi:hypothetical protein
MPSLFSPVRAIHSINQLDQRQLNSLMPEIQAMADNTELLEQTRQRRFQPR